MSDAIGGNAVGMNDLSAALATLSAMITPAVLILACGSLILTTSQRLTRVIDRVRELSSEIEMLAADTRSEDFVQDKRKMLFELLEKAINRARLLQRAITRLYLALSSFVATSVAIGIISLTRINFGAVALVLGFIGLGLTLTASFLLIAESRIGLASTFTEMDFLWKRGQHHAPPETREGQAARSAMSNEQ